MVHDRRLEPALLADVDPVDYAHLLSTLHTARCAGRPLPARPRPVIEHSWNRMQRIGVPVDRQDPDVDERAMEEARSKVITSYGTRADQLEKIVGSILEPTLADSGLVGIFATTDARVSARFGDLQSLHDADRIGFVPGARWGENTVGTNAIDMASRLSRPIQVHGPEHWCLDQHTWSCAAAPLRDPATGTVLAVLDVSGPLAVAHPAVLGLIRSVAAQVEMTLGDQHRRELSRLRARSWNLVAGMQSPWVLCDRHGWVIGASDVVSPDRIHWGETSTPPASGQHVLPGIGVCLVDNLGDVVLITPVTSTPTEHCYVLDASAHTLELTLGECHTAHQLSGKHVAILMALLQATAPLAPSDLAAAAWSDPHISEVAVRAEVSRLRKRFPELISLAPYRLLASVRCI